MPMGSLLEAQQRFTGWLIPWAWVDALPTWANTPVWGQVTWKWIAVLALFVLAVVVVLAVYRLGRRRPWDGSFLSYLGRLGAPLAVIVMEPLLRFLVRVQINVTGVIAEAPDFVIEVASSLATIWLIWLSAAWLADAIVSSPKVNPKSLDAHLIRVTARLVGIAALTVFLFRLAADLGVPVYGLVAGAGVGGLAIALAARSTLEDFLGTLKLYADRPVRVGDLCRYGEDPSPEWLRVGTIEAIGLRSTRIRGIDRTVTTIANASFANMEIVNLTKRDRMVFRPTLSLRHETTLEQLRVVLVQLRELLVQHPRVADDTVCVRFAGFGEYSLDIEVLAYINTSDRNEFRAVREDLGLSILSIVEEAGTGFATPSRLYLARDSGMEGKPREEAARQLSD
jgi:MscS family membrane protein